MSDKLLSIGMPVYNGGEAMRRAIESLLSQTYTNFELIISDNASTDGITQAITEEYASRDPRIRLTRQPHNQGVIENFLWVLSEARGDFFMWAAHDDAWADNYLEALARRLDTEPDAVLAASRTLVSAGNRHGKIDEILASEPPEGDRWKILRVFAIEKFASTWVYGLYRREWLLIAAKDWQLYSMYYGDLIWMFGILLKSKVVGTPATTFYYTSEYKKYNHIGFRRKMEVFGSAVYHTTRLAWQMPSGDRYRSLIAAGTFSYHRILRRGNPIRTVARTFKLLAIWSWISLENGAIEALRRLRRPKTLQPVDGHSENTAVSATDLHNRHAA